MKEPETSGVPERREFTPAERRQLKDRDSETMGLFYEVYFDRVYAYVRRLMGAEHTAEDVTQDIFMQLYRSFDQYDPERALSPWVFRIAMNKVRDLWRSRRFQDARREASLDDEENAPHIAVDAPEPGAALAAEEFSQSLDQAIDQLPDSMRTTFVLRYFEGLSFEAIGKIIDRNETAVRKRYSRSLEELRKFADKGLGIAGGGAS